jgi:hypothetical protein
MTEKELDIIKNFNFNEKRKLVLGDARSWAEIENFCNKHDEYHYLIIDNKDISFQERLEIIKQLQNLDND